MVSNYLRDDINKLQNLENQLLRNVQALESVPELTLKEQYDCLHISQELKQFCSKMNLKDVKFMVKSDGLLFGNCTVNELKGD